MKIETLKQAKQIAFDRAYRGLASQDWKRSMRPGRDGQCAYRGESGLKCAIGWLIPEERYESQMEGPPVGWTYVAAYFASDLTKWFLSGIENHKEQEEFLSFLRDMQVCHDRVTDSGMEQAFKRFAREHDLKVPS